MEIENFSKEIKEVLEQKTECKVEEMQVRKNNGVMLYAISLKDDGINIAPTIYLEKYFEEYRECGCSIEKVAEKIMEIYYRYRFEHNIEMDFFNCYESAKNRIVYKLINYEKNKELLEEIPFIKFQDLAIVFYYLADVGEFKNATILIHNKHLEGWGVSTEEIYNVARENTPKLLKYRLQGMMQVLKGLIDDDVFTEDEMEEYVQELIKIDESGLYVLNNSSKLFGAGTILYGGVLKEFADKMQSNLFILPSSVHEVVLISDGEQHIGKEKLKKMVMEVNEMAVEPEEFLSDSIYYYDRNTDKIEIA